MPGPGKNTGDSQTKRKSSRIQEKKSSTSEISEEENPAKKRIDGTTPIMECTGRYSSPAAAAETRDPAFATRELGQSHAHETDEVSKSSSIHDKLDRIMVMLEGVVNRLEKTEAKINKLEE